MALKYPFIKQKVNTVWQNYWDSITIPNKLKGNNKKKKGTFLNISKNVRRLL